MTETVGSEVERLPWARRSRVQIPDLVNDVHSHAVGALGSDRAGVDRCLKQACFTAGVWDQHIKYHTPF